MATPYRFLTQFNKHILPITAPLVSGYILGYMVADSDAHNKFQKYKRVHLNALPHHTFYVYTYSEEEYKKCSEALQKLENLQT